VLQRGHETLSGLIPHLFLTSVPWITNPNPTASTPQIIIRPVIDHLSLSAAVHMTQIRRTLPKCLSRKTGQVQS
jgi:hypothetical protein